MSITRTPSAARNDQKPGTSGLRKKTATFLEPGFLEHYVQAIFEGTGGVDGKTLVIGGDGRHGNVKAIQTIIRMAAAGGAARLIVARDGLLSTPAASNVIRKYATDGGIILSASHNPGGPDGDFGVKFNGANGGPAAETINERIFAATQTDLTVTNTDTPDIDLSTPGTAQVLETRVEIIDPVADYCALMEELFDFDAMRTLIGNGTRLRFDAMHAITGPYATEILENRLGCPAGTVINAVPLPDFGQGHPDPNPTWARELFDAVVERGEADLAAASDGDGDRNMIVGKGIYVTPSDSLAIITEHAHRIPAYAGGLSGVARSMPTSAAVDRVAQALGIDCYVTPTGWKFFGSLLDADRITLCGEESFGTGSNHVREKDGLWAFLCWLNIMAATGKSAKALVEDHWQRFGRTFYTRHDYEEVPVDKAQAVTNRAIAAIENGTEGVVAAENFAYTDPVDGSRADNQGYRFELANGSRAIMRLSGTGTVGATIRLYFEQHVADEDRFCEDTQAVLKEAIDLAETVLQVRANSGKAGPDVIT